MSKITVYGIKNCNTMKKAFAWLDKHKVDYAFHDYKKEGADMAALKTAVKKFGWEDVLNRKGMSWRNLPEKVKTGMTEKRALEEAEKNPSLIRRPMIVKGASITFGFDADDYKKAFAGKGR